MKYLFLSVLTLVCGFIAWTMITHDADVFSPAAKQFAAEKTSQAQDKAWELAQQQYRDACKAHFLRQTGCFQKRKATECDQEIIRQCGSADLSKPE